jgi:transposase
MAKTTTYTPEYKREIVKLVTEKGKTRAEVAESIGVSRTTINEWVKKYKEHGNDAFPGKGHLLPQDEELRKLRKLNKDLEEENAILKKAMAIFSRSVK